MKKLLTLLSIVLFATACSKDDNVIYDEAKGYLTNIKSVYYGLVGCWDDGDGATICYENNRKFHCPTCLYAEVDSPFESAYSITFENEKFYLNTSTKTIRGTTTTKGEIEMLSDTMLVLKLEGKTTSHQLNKIAL